MNLAIDILSWLALVGGAVFCIIGAAGILRFPEFYSRTHAAGITDTMGAGLILLGLLLQAYKLGDAHGWTAGTALVLVKLVMVWGFILVTSPVAGHALVKAAFSSGVKVVTDDEGIQRLPGEDEEDVPG